MPKIYVPQKNQVIECVEGENLMDALMRVGLPVASSCLGEGVCSKCVVEVFQIEPSSPTQKQPSQKSLPSELEVRTLTRNKLNLVAQPNLRLSCQCSVTQDIEVRTSYW